jgi:Cys-tRNA(Pro)/Cys-tRNA(Cys) deacylase
MSSKKTNAARLLDRLTIDYRLQPYDFDPDDLSGEKVARQIGLPPHQVFKTLVCRGDRHGVALAVLPSDRELDLKALARLSGDRKIEIVPLKQVQSLTGYMRGGVTALACKKAYAVYVDRPVEEQPEIAVSAGQRGLQIILSPADYLQATGACVGELSREKSSRA